jgi:hypothetical protein
VKAVKMIMQAGVPTMLKERTYADRDRFGSSSASVWHHCPACEAVDGRLTATTGFAEDWMRQMAVWVAW